MSGYFWVVFGFLIVAVSKYLTSVRLRGLAEKMQREMHDASELRTVLVQAEEKEQKLNAESEKLQGKVNALKNVVGNIERSIQRLQKGGSAAAEQDDTVQAR